MPASAIYTLVGFFRPFAVGSAESVSASVLFSPTLPMVPHDCLGLINTGRVKIKLFGYIKVSRSVFTLLLPSPADEFVSASAVAPLGKDLSHLQI